MSKFDFAKPGKIGLSSDALDRLGQVLRRDVEEGRIPGAVALIAREGRIGYCEAFGVRDPSAPDPMATDAIFRIYSMTKPIVSTAIMQLVEEGRILLADPVSNYIPAFTDSKVAMERDGGELEFVPAHRPITVQDLLRHTSGLTYDFELSGPSPVQKIYAEANLRRSGQTVEGLAADLAKLPLVRQPGAGWDYGFSTDVLARIVEIVSGRKLSEELRDRIFAPLGMKDTGFAVPAQEQGRVAEPFPTDPGTGAAVKLIPVREEVTLELGGGGLFSTAMDYARFCAALAGGGSLGKTRILGRKTLEWMTSDHLEADVLIGSDLLPPGHGFGLGFAVRITPGLAAVPGSVGTFYWGGIAGTTFWVDPEEDLFAILLIQAPGQREHYRMLFRNLVYAAVE